MLLLVAAALHCPLEWQAAIGQMVEIARLRAAGEALPIGMPLPGCENESGCICRGATVAHAVDISCLARDVGHWLPPSDPSAFQCIEVGDSANVRSPDSKCLAPPITGRQLRALYASLVI